MKALAYRGAAKVLTLAVVFGITVTPLATYAQTPTPTPTPTQIKIHSNKFALGDDVKLGQEAAGQAEKQMQLVRDPELGDYLERVGQRLAAAIPTEFQHPEFRYSFKVVNAKDINAFALPGGPMYVNSGMIAAARSEDEMAGVMAHEISHVALRHGTAQVTKAQKYQMLSGIMGIGGQILGGPIGTIAQMGSQGVGVYLLKFSREYETEADLLGARIMANAGYDPRELANMFKTIESQGGSGGPGFLSDHPSPKDRVAKINQEAQALQINTTANIDRHDFTVAQQRLTGRGGGLLRPRGRRRLAVLFDVVAVVHRVRVVLLALHRPRGATRDPQRLLARRRRADRGRHREQLLGIRVVTARALRRLADLHELLEALSALAAFVFVNRHAARIPSAAPRTKPRPSTRRSAGRRAALGARSGFHAPVRYSIG